jgi:hypothetical protein
MDSEGAKQRKELDIERRRLGMTIMLIISTVGSKRGLL